MDWGPYIDQVEAEIRAVVSAPDAAMAPFYGMMAYHLGWLDKGFQSIQVAGGKRFRPVICLLACQAQKGRWEHAVPAAAAIELVHNFTLIHDDIEDSSPLRRHRETLWNIWGIPQALNAGDGMYVLSHLAMQRLVQRGIKAETVLSVSHILDEASLKLCHGQYLDIAFEESIDISVAEYLHMIGAKSAALISASTEIGAVLGGGDGQVAGSYSRFGWEMGLAFQMVDDILGIWGDPKVTGKSSASDILSRKKTLPVLYALNELETGTPDQARRGERLRQIYLQENVESSDVSEVMALLDEVSARAYVQAEAQAHTKRALEALAEAGLQGEAQDHLSEIAQSFLGRTF